MLDIKALRADAERFLGELKREMPVSTLTTFSTWTKPAGKNWRQSRN